MTLIWATRGRTWGFRFLRDGGFADPLPEYDAAFAGLGMSRRSVTGSVTRWRCASRIRWAKRPAGRVIPHEFVVFRPLADQIESVEDGRRLVWDLVSAEYARLWEPGPDDSAARA